MPDDGHDRGRLRVGIIGTGFSGLGTWRDNTYPGCACDIPSQLYSFSYARILISNDWYPAVRRADVDLVTDAVRRVVPEGVETAIDAMRRRGADSIDTRRDAQARFVAWADEELAGSIWASGCSSWYLTEGGEKPRIDTLWPRSTMSYWWRTRRFAEDDYSFGGEPAPVPVSASSDSSA